MLQDTIIILDNGHGGIDKGVYVTAPAKMHRFEDGFTVYEGHFNREIVKKIAYRLKTLGIPHFILVPGPDDMPLPKRVSIANEVATKHKGKAIYISIHGNAGGGSGFEVFTSKGQTLSDTIADFYIDAMSAEFPDRTARVDLTDGDKDKEANFYVLKNTSCPAILTENFFMDNRADAELMMSYEGMTKIVNAHIKTIQMALEADLFTPKAVETKPKAVEAPKPKAKPTPKKGKK